MGKNTSIASTQHDKNNSNTTTTTTMFSRITTFLVALVAILSVASASRTLLQDQAATGAMPTIPTWYPGFGAQFLNPQAWTNFYSQAIPYDIYANWVNTNTAFNLPMISGLPGLPPTGST